jgi:hypothetical protein
MDDHRVTVETFRNSTIVTSIATYLVALILVIFMFADFKLTREWTHKNLVQPILSRAGKKKTGHDTKAPQSDKPPPGQVASGVLLANKQLPASEAPLPSNPEPWSIRKVLDKSTAWIERRKNRNKEESHRRRDVSPHKIVWEQIERRKERRLY